MSAASVRHALHVEENPRFTSSPYEPELPAVQRLDQINLLDRALYAQGDPHAAWRLLREQAPVFWHEQGTAGTEGKGFWVLSRYDDELIAYRNSQVFSSETGPFLDLSPETMPKKMLASIDGRLHKMNRGLVVRFFTPSAVAKWSVSIRSTVTELLDNVADRVECDFLTDIASGLPVIATCNLLGMAPEEATALAATLAAAEADSPETLQEFNDATLAFFDRVAAERRKSGAKDSIIGAVANETLEGAPLPDDETAHLLWNLFFGGVDATIHAATAMLLTLFHHPDQLQILRNDPALVEGAMDELLRWTSTSHTNKRQVLQDIEVHGTRLKKGDYVTMWSPSANRDELAFADPYRFDVRRVMSRPIMTFGGGGPHQCLGQFFARVELRILIEELLRRFPDVEQSGRAVRGNHFSVITAAFRSLPIRLRRAS
ncbi:MAG: cytochrome P450 [Steroidobacteraceae bacterium]